MIYFSRFITRLSVNDLGSGSFGFATSGILGTFLALTITVLFISNTIFTRTKKNILFVLLFLALALTYSGGGLIILVITITSYLFIAGNYKKLITIGLVSLFGITLIISTHTSLMNILPYNEGMLISQRQNLVEYTLKRFENLGDISTANSYQIRSLGRNGALISSYKYNEIYGDVFFGSGTGSLNRAGALGNYFEVSQSTNFNKVFAFNSDYVNTYAIAFGEIGIVGLIVLFLILLLLLNKRYKFFFNKKIIKLKWVFFFVFCIYSYYETSIFAFQFLFIWSLIAFNLEKLEEL